jgi:hypothetical protein
MREVVKTRFLENSLGQENLCNERELERQTGRDTEKQGERERKEVERKVVAGNEKGK